MNRFNEFGGVGRLDHCVWCGRKLRRPPHIEGREPKLGDYADGLFCGLRCGYMFGRKVAELGQRIVDVPPPRPAKPPG